MLKQKREPKRNNKDFLPRANTLFNFPYIKEFSAKKIISTSSIFDTHVKYHVFYLPVTGF